jgi:hypothetical protein
VSLPMAIRSHPRPTIILIRRRSWQKKENEDWFWTHVIHSCGLLSANAEEHAQQSR